jgi:hypothetical protein
VQPRPCRHTAWRSFASTLFPSQVRSSARSPLCFLTRQATMYLRSHLLEVCRLSHHRPRPCGRGLVEAPRRQAAASATEQGFVTFFKDPRPRTPRTSKWTRSVRNYSVRAPFSLQTPAKAQSRSNVPSAWRGVGLLGHEQIRFP